MALHPAARHPRTFWLAPAMAGALFACSGNISSQPNGDTGTDEPGTGPGAGGQGGRAGTGGAGMTGAGNRPVDAQGCALPSRRLRQLTAQQVENALAVLFPKVKAALDLPRPGRGENGFSNDSDRLMLTVSDVQKQVTSMAVVADAAAADPAALAPCLKDGLATACVRSFVERFTKLAYRGPVEASEVDDLVAFASAQKTAHGDEKALALLLRRVLLSPRFMFRSEVGTVKEGVAELDGYEKASVLSFTLTDGPPDAELMEAASSGKLDSAAGMRQQAERLLGGAQNAAGARRLFRELFRTESMGSVVKDDVFEGWSSQIAADTRTEAEAFIDHVLWQDDGRLDTLLTAPYTMANKRLATFYGLSGANSLGDSFAKIDYGSEPRSGILGKGGWLSLLAHAGQNDLVKRGRFVREMLLCESVPDPPPTIKAVPPPPGGDLTLREKLVQHAQDPNCSGCHDQMDKIGFAFERFDGVGKFRETDNGKPIDARGEIVNSEASNGSFDGAVALAKHLAASPQVHACIVKHGFRFAFGRVEKSIDACQLDKFAKGFADAQGNLRTLLLDLVTSPAFSQRAAVFE
ncbi:MAG: DUF1588 domain-containing protein [Myxococcales bacterium]|nr:DUF1588 domain-containing protein [Myxococcales bacterium]